MHSLSLLFFKCVCVITSSSKLYIYIFFCSSVSMCVLAYIFVCIHFYYCCSSVFARLHVVVNIYSYAFISVGTV